MRKAARELIQRIPDGRRFDAAAIATVDVTDERIEECRRRFPNGGEEFRRCIRGKKLKSR
jgi:hypothetical protein